jgi:hypothetical protein
LHGGGAVRRLRTVLASECRVTSPRALNPEACGERYSCRERT